MKVHVSWMVVLPLLGLLVSGCSGKGETTPAAATATKDLPAGNPADMDPAKQRKTATDRRLAAGMAYLQVKDLEGARRHFTRALELDPDSGAANNAMALLYRAEGDPKREEEYYRRALRKEPGFSAARNNYATFLYAKGRYKEAAEQLQRAADDETYDQRGMAFYNLGRCQVRLGNLEAADAAFQRAIRLDSRRPEPLLAMARLGMQRERYREAWTYYQNWAARTKQTAATLLFGIRLAEKVGDKDAVASYELQFDKFFRGSPQHKAWQAWRAGGPEPGVESGDGDL